MICTLYERDTTAGRRWGVRYRDPQTGRVVKKIVAETKARANEIRQHIERGLWGPLDRTAKPPVLFEVFADQYLAWVKANKKSWRRVDVIVRRLGRAFSGKPLVAITVPDIERFKTTRGQECRQGTDRKVSPREVDYALAVLKGMFTKAIAWGEATANPVKQVKFHKAPNNRTRYLDQKEVHALLDACEGRLAYLRPVVTVALHTGLRKSEILHLKWADVDLKAGVLHIRQAKNGKARTAPINDAVRVVLRDCIRVKEVLEQTDGMVFAGPAGKPIRSLDGGFRQALRRAGIRDFRFHDLRHTFASHLANSGKVTLQELQQLMGHGSVLVTERYAHLFPNRGQRAVALLPDLYAGGTDVAPKQAGEVSK